MIAISEGVCFQVESPISSSVQGVRSMAAVPTFKQPCPSCEAMVTIKENQIGKKVECTQCKDKFVAEKPPEEKKKSATVAKNDQTSAKKSTTVQKKASSGVATKKTGVKV